MSGNQVFAICVAIIAAAAMLCIGLRGTVDAIDRNTAAIERVGK